MWRGVAWGAAQDWGDRRGWGFVLGAAAFNTPYRPPTRPALLAPTPPPSLLKTPPRSRPSLLTPPTQPPLLPPHLALWYPPPPTRHP